MDYDIYNFHLSARLERHNSAGDIADNAAWYRFEQEVRAMIDADPDYLRIFNWSQRISTRVA